MMKLYCSQHPRYLAVRPPRVRGKLTCHCWLLYYVAKVWRAVRHYIPLPVLTVGTPWVKPETPAGEANG